MSAPRAIGVDLGGTKILGGVVGRDGVVHRREGRPTPVSSEEELLAELDDAVEALLGDDVAALGFGIPSQIDQRTGHAVASVHVPLADVDIRARMAGRFGLPVGIDNDGNAAAIAEWKLGAGRGASNVVLLTLGTGIGGGLILDGKPFRGAVGAGAELGHLVLQYGGPPCPGACTGHGHFEALAAGSVADELAERRYGPGADARRLVDEAEGGDEGAVADLAELGHRLGAGIGSLVNIFNPEVVVLGGGFAVAGELILGPARETLAVEALPLPGEMVRVVFAELGAEAGMVGAALVGFEALDGSV
ncbi:MAG TPA: ROK family protein [Gaiellaceae bacterium]|nr:ROK family protein [Gaiellaceae bacterium]